SPDSRILAAGGGTDAVVLWDVASGEILQKLQHFAPEPCYTNSLSFSPDGKVLAGGSTDETIRLWDVPAGKLVRQIDAKSGYGQTVCFSPDGKVLASGDAEKGALWDPATGKLIRTLSDPLHRTDAVIFEIQPRAVITFSPDGKTLAWSRDHA